MSKETINPVDSENHYARAAEVATDLPAANQEYNNFVGGESNPPLSPRGETIWQKT